MELLPHLEPCLDEHIYASEQTLSICTLTYTDQKALKLSPFKI